MARAPTWRKLHLGIHPETGEIQAALMTDNRVSDDAAVGDLLAQIPARLNACLADGAYDKRKVYDQLNAHSPQVTIVIPPRRDARLWRHGNAHTERLKRMKMCAPSGGWGGRLGSIKPVITSGRWSKPLCTV